MRPAFACVNSPMDECALLNCSLIVKWIAVPSKLLVNREMDKCAF